MSAISDLLHSVSQANWYTFTFLGEKQIKTQQIYQKFPYSTLISIDHRNEVIKYWKLKWNKEMQSKTKSTGYFRKSLQSARATAHKDDGIWRVLCKFLLNVPNDISKLPWPLLPWFKPSSTIALKLSSSTNSLRRKKRYCQLIARL